MMVKTLLFDINGTLVDSKDSWYHSINEIFKSELDEGIIKEEVEEKYLGYDLRYIFEGVEYTLENLDGYKRAVITNTPVDCTRGILNEFGIEKYFDAVITSTNVDKGKLEQDIIYRVCEEVSVEPGGAVVLDDYRVDVDVGNGVTEGEDS